MGYESEQPVIVGGYTGAEYLNTVEAFGQDGWSILGDEIPTTIYQHCTAGISSIFHLLGGIQGSEYSSTAYMWTLFAWDQYSAFNVARSRFSCGFAYGSVAIPVVAGGFNGEYLRTTEWFDIDTESWVFGPDLPQALCCASSYMNDDGFYIIGGHTAEGKFLDTIYYLKDINSEWVELEQKLTIARDYPTTFGIPDDLAQCE